MKQRYLSTLASVRCGGGSADFQDPTVFCENQVTPHTPLQVFSSKQDCVSIERAPSTWTKKIVDVERPVTCPFGLFSSPLDVPEKPSQVSYDREVTVPMNWQMDEAVPELLPVYTNIFYPWKRSGCGPGKMLSTSVPTENNYTGVYRFPLDINSDWRAAIQAKKRGLYVVLHGVSSAVRVFLNDQYVGYGQDSMTESEFELTKYLNLEGNNNVLYLVVIQYSDGSYLEDQDHWWLSGIFRDVDLQCRPVDGIIDYIVKAEPNAENSAAAFSVDVFRSSGQEAKVIATILDPEGNAVATLDSSFSPSATHTNLSTTLSSPLLWSPNAPHLYTLILELMNASDQSPIQCEKFQFGCRKVLIKDGQLLVNGEALLVCGVNRHEHHPTLGKVISESSMIADIKLLKQYNFNAVRCSHYPNRHRWYELCDSLGLYCVDEANMECHGFTLGGAISILQCDPKWRNQIIYRTQAMALRTRNHSCIIVWSLGNESGCGPNTVAAAEWLRGVDPTRPIQYEGGISSGDSPLIMGDGQDPNTTDIICPMYHDTLQITSHVNKPGENRPLILCEYSHAMGNSNGGLHLYFNLFKSSAHPQIQGGFIWDFVDQGLILPAHNKGEWGYGGDFGPDSGKMDSTFCINGLVFPDRTVHPAMYEAKYLQQPIKIEYSARLAGSIDVLLTNERPADCPPFSQLELRSYCITQLAPAPMPVVSALNGDKQATTEVKVSEDVSHGLWLKLEVVLNQDTRYAPKGHCISTETFCLNEPGKLVQELVVKSGSSAFKAEKTSKELNVKTSNYTATFDLALGELGSIVNSGGDALLSSPVEHCFYRACTDNDLGGATLPVPLNKYRSYASQWRGMGLSKIERLIIKSAVIESDENHVTVLVVAQHVALKSILKWVLFTTTTKYTFTTTAVKIDVTVESTNRTKTAKSLPRIGLTFDIPNELSTVSWKGRGPHECYPDRKAGAPEGVYKASIDTMHVPYIQPSENGGRADVEWCAFTNASQKGLLVNYTTNDPAPAGEIKEGFDGQPAAVISPRPYGMTGAQLSVSPYTVQSLDEAKHQHELKKSNSVYHVNIDTAHMGLGGDISWLPYTHDQYLVHGNKWTYAVTLTPCDFGLPKL